MPSAHPLRGAEWICSILDKRPKQQWDGGSAAALGLNDLQTEFSGAQLVQMLLKPSLTLFDLQKSHATSSVS